MRAVIMLVMFWLGSAGARAQQPPVCNTVTLAGNLAHTIRLDNPGVFAIVRAADLNNDGLDDILLFGAFGDILASLVNQGDGTFQLNRPAASWRADRVEGIAVLDLNGDEFPDIVTKSSGRLLTGLHGRGDGRFVVAWRGGNAIRAISEFETSDIDGDGDTDIIGLTEGFLRLLIFRNEGGRFDETPREIELPIGRGAMAVGDFDGDGKTDLAVAGAGRNPIGFPNSVSNSVVLLRGDNTGDFQLFGDGSGPFVGRGPGDILAEDLNGDGALDVAVIAPDQLSVLHGDGKGGLRLAFETATPWPSASIVAADFNGDGLIDLAADSREGRPFAVFLNDGQGRFPLDREFEWPFDSGVRFRGIRLSSFLVAGSFEPGRGTGLLDYGVETNGEEFSAQFTLFANTCPLDVTLAAEPETLIAGDPFQYRVTVRNVSAETTLPGVRVSETFVGHFLPRSVTGSRPGACGGAVPSCTIGDLAPGESFEALIQAETVRDREDPVLNRISVSGTGYGPFSLSVTNRVVFGVDLRVSLSAEPSPAVEGQELVFTAVAVNTGNDPAEEVTLKMTLPPAAEFVAAPGCQRSEGRFGDTVSCALGDFAPREQRRIVVTTWLPGLSPDVILSASLEVLDGAEADTFPADNKTELVLSVVAPGVQPRNSGFESGSLESWRIEGDRAAAEVFQSGRRGSFSAGIRGEGFLFQDVRGLRPGQLYSVSVWVKSSDVNLSVAARLDVHDRTGRGPGTDSLLAAARQWTRLQTLFRAGPAGVMRIELRGPPEGDSGALFDDIRIEAVNPRTFRVPEDFTRIQDALDAASDGDSIVVAPGTYRENISFLGKAVVVESRDGPRETVLDGGLNGPGVEFVNGEPAAATLRGLHVRNSVPGILISGGSPRIEDNRIWDNGMSRFAGAGGGIFVTAGSPVIAGNSIDGNQALSGGGIAVRFGAPRIINNSITENLSSFGGGVFLVGSRSLLERNLIERNEASRDGGGLYMLADLSRAINNTFRGNKTSDDGGGVSVSGGETRLEQNLLVGNEARRGGGVALQRDGESRFIFVHNTVAANRAARGSAILLGFGPQGGTVVNNILASPDETSAVSCGSFEAAGQFGANLAFSADGDALENCPLGGLGNLIQLDPLFVNPSAGDFRLRLDSPGIDAAEAVEAPELDFDGRPRIADGNQDGKRVADFGAYETPPPRRPPVRSRSSESSRPR